MGALTSPNRRNRGQVYACNGILLLRSFSGLRIILFKLIVASSLWQQICALFGPVSGDVFIPGNKSAKKSNKASNQYRAKFARAAARVRQPNTFRIHRSWKFFLVLTLLVGMLRLA